MNCRNVRHRVAEGRPGDGLAPTIGEHLRSCEECAAFAERHRLAVELLAERRAEVEPDAGFAARVLTALPEPEDALGWAALKILPASLALALVLVGWTLWQTQSPASLVQESPSDDVLAWVLENGESDASVSVEDVP